MDRWIKNPRTIVDAGAYIGITTVEFAKKYPSATIIAIEPQADNFALLQTNTASLPNVKTTHGALWYQDKALTLSNPTPRSWTFQASEDSSSATETVPAITLSSLLSQYGSIDVLKLDVEGAEWPLFEKEDPAVLKKISIYVAELHDDHPLERLKAVCQQPPTILSVQHEKVVFTFADAETH